MALAVQREEGLRTNFVAAAQHECAHGSFPTGVRDARMTVTRDMRPTVRRASITVSALLSLATLGACQALPDVQPFLPRDETPVMPPAFAVEVPRGPSGQRVDQRGYPMLGHMPRAAGPQASAETVTSTQARYATVETRGSAPTAAGIADLQGLAAQRAAVARSGEYRRSVEELRTLAERQRAGSQTR